MNLIDGVDWIKFMIFILRFVWLIINLRLIFKFIVLDRDSQHVLLEYLGYCIFIIW
jgi:hypothetical protein